MQPAPQLVAYRASRSTSSMRRFAAAAVGVALLLVAAVALASSQASSSSLAAPAEALPADKEVAATEASTTHVHKKSSKNVDTSGSAYVNAFTGREKIGKRSHEDFGKVAMEMIKKLDKELPSISHHHPGAPPPAPEEHWSDQQIDTKNRPVKLEA